MGPRVVAGIVALALLGGLWVAFRGEAPEAAADPLEAPIIVSGPPADEPAVEPTDKIRVAATAEGARTPSTEAETEPTDGFEVRGVVTGPDGVGYGGARVTVRWEQGDRWPRRRGRLEATTDAAGRFAIGADEALAGRDLTARLGVLFRAAAVAPGLSGRTGLPERLRHPAARIVCVDISLSADTSTTGRVVDSVGEPVADAEIHIREESAGLESSVGRTDESGVFRAVVPGAGSYLVSAHAPGTGVGTAGPFVLDPRVATTLPDLIVDAPGSVEGMATLPDGRPAVDLQVLAFPASEIARDARHLLGERWHVGPTALEGLAGAWPVTATTDATGAFRIDGLAPIEHFLLVRAPEPAPDRRALHSPGAAGVLLRVERYRLRVDVRGPDGEQLDAHVAFLHDMGGYPPRGLDIDGRPFTDQFQPGDEVTVEAFAPGIGSAMKTMTLTEGVYETVLEIVLDSEVVGTGRLALTATASDESIDRLRVILHRAGGSTWLTYAGWNLEIDAFPGTPFSVPAGRWNLEVVEAGAPWIADPHRGSWFFPVRSSVVIDADQTTTSDLALTPGGRIAVEVTRADGRADAVRPLRTHARTARGTTKLRVWSAPATLPIGVVLTPPELLPVGPTTLVLVCDGFAPIERQFTIEPGKTTHLAVVLQPR